MGIIVDNYYSAFNDAVGIFGGIVENARGTGRIFMHAYFYVQDYAAHYMEQAAYSPVRTAEVL